MAIPTSVEPWMLFYIAQTAGSGGGLSKKDCGPYGADDLDGDVRVEMDGVACKRESDVARLPPDGCDVKARDGKDVESELHGSQVK
jgi:hypothetical protein